MKPARIIFEKRYNTGNYEHENITVEYVFEEGDSITAAEGLLKARADVVQASTAYLKAMKEKEGKK